MWTNNPELRAAVTAGRRLGYVLCPLHDERTPSCMVWAEPERGWWCFGCGRGGGIYDLAALLDGRSWGAALKGEEFRCVREMLQATLGTLA